MSLTSAYSKMKQSGHSMSSDACNMCKGGCNYAEGGGVQSAQDSMRRAFGTPKKLSEGGEVKGVHKASLPEEPGKSRSHYRLHAAKRSAGPVKEENVEKAKNEHTRVLGEIVQMQKPKLKGLAHGGEVNGFDLNDQAVKKFMDKGESAVGDGKEVKGEFHDSDKDMDEMHEGVAKEMMDCMKDGDHKGMADCLKALIMSMKG